MAQPSLPSEPTVARSGSPPEPDRIIVLRGATWADYQRLMEIRGDAAVPRIAYCDGELELMSPSRSHEAIKSMLGCLVEAWCLEKGVEITPYGAWTHESKGQESGAEPDECYVLGDNEAPERCDLAIEVVWTSGGIQKLEVYRRLQVREVWIWNENAISRYELRGAQYEAISQSGLLPDLDLGQLLEFVEVRPMTRAVREYRRVLGGGARSG